jgi:hypothetical protein
MIRARVGVSDPETDPAANRGSGASEGRWWPGAGQPAGLSPWLLLARGSLPNPTEVQVAWGGIVVRKMTACNGPARVGAAVLPFVGLDMAVGVGHYGGTIVQAGRIMHEAIGEHVHAEGWGTNAHRINIDEDKAVGGLVGT